MEINNVIDGIQIFANEYASPESVVLILTDRLIQELRYMFGFINCEFYVLNDKMLPGIDITFDKILPLFDNTFDIIICLKEIENDELERVLKKKGKIFKKL